VVRAEGAVRLLGGRGVVLRGERALGWLWLVHTGSDLMRAVDVGIDRVIDFRLVYGPRL
jgi:hypothetical protein